MGEVAKLASIAPPSVYFYFNDIEELVLYALDDALKERLDWAAMVSAFTPDATLTAKVRAFVRSFLEFWDKHYGLLRVRTLKADEGEPRFLENKRADLLPVVLALEAKIDEFHSRFGVEPAVPSPAQALVLMGMLERVGPVLHVGSTRAGCSRNQIISATVQQFVRGLLPSGMVV